MNYEQLKAERDVAGAALAVAVRRYVDADDEMRDTWYRFMVEAVERYEAVEAAAMARMNARAQPRLW